MREQNVRYTSGRWERAGTKAARSRGRMEQEGFREEDAPRPRTRSTNWSCCDGGRRGREDAGKGRALGGNHLCGENKGQQLQAQRT